MPTLNSIKDLEKYINQKAKQALNQGSAVKTAVIETGKKHVQEDVYDVYKEPFQYERTGELKNSWETEPTPDGIAVYNNRTDNGKDVAYIVETGEGYTQKFAYDGVPRPFTANTKAELSKGNVLNDAMKEDLRSVGLKTN